MGKIILFILGVLMVFGGVKAIYTRSIYISWNEAGEDFKRRTGIFAVIWGLFFLLCGIYSVVIAITQKVVKAVSWVRP